jgi:uncharacterized protein YifN (PemK superfamily)
MSIKYPPKIGSILLCDYSLGGFREPEMVKRRPAIVVSPKLNHRNGLCAVVPLSTSAPVHTVSYVVELELPTAPPAPFDSVSVFAKCDMLSTVCFERLDMFRTGRDQYGKRKYLDLRISSEQMDEIHIAIKVALGIVN